jgi:hypothetical protein
MKTSPSRIGSVLLATLALGACTEQATSPSRLGPGPSSRLSIGSSAPSLNGVASSVLDGATVFDRMTAVGAGVINPGDYVCPATTDVNDWINGKLAATLSVEPDRFFQAYDLAAADVPFYEALFFEVPSSSQYFGYAGEHTKAVEKTERQLKGFWDIPSDIDIVPMHGSTLLDVNRVAATYEFAYGIPAPVAQFYADTLRRTLANSQTMKDGNHPFFTFNSVSVGAVPGLVGNKIVMGDGIMAVFDDLGYGDVAPQAILAHEFAHQVQFNKHFGISGSAAERTRFGELNADAMSAFFLTHKRGATLNQKRVEEFLRVFYDIGDCQFASSGHHGTPNQRMAAAQFGFQLAHDAQKQGHLVTANEFQAQFLAAYPSLIAPDAY